jgi:hypothetical protein
MSSQKLCYSEIEEVIDVGVKWKTKAYIGMTYQTNFGRSWNRCCQEEKVAGEDKLRTTVDL